MLKEFQQRVYKVNGIGKIILGMGVGVSTVGSARLLSSKLTFGRQVL